MTTPIDLYYWPTPNGWKVTILLEELEAPYNLHLINIGKGDQFEPEFLKIAPNNRMPAIVDPEPLGGGAPISISLDTAKPATTEPRRKIDTPVRKIRLWP